MTKIIRSRLYAWYKKEVEMVLPQNNGCWLKGLKTYIPMFLFIDSFVEQLAGVGKIQGAIPSPEEYGADR